MFTYQMRYVGADRLPRNLPERDVAEYFTLSRADVEALRERLRNDRYPKAEDRVVGLAVQMLLMRATGRAFDQVSSVPPVLLRSIGRALQIDAPKIASLRAIYKRAKTLYTQQQWAREYLDLRSSTAQDLEKLRPILAAQAQEVSSSDELVAFVKEWFFDANILIPGERVIRTEAGNAFANVQRNAIAVMKQAVPEKELHAGIECIYKPKPGTSRTILEWLKRPPKRHSQGTLTTSEEKIRFLKALNVHNWDLRKISLARQNAYAQALANRAPAEVKRRSTDLQCLQIVCFLRITLLEISETYLQIAARRTSDLVRRANDKISEADPVSLNGLRRQVAEIRNVVKDKNRPVQERMDAIEFLVDALGDLTVEPRAAQLRKALIEDSSRVHSLLKSLSEIDFKSHGKDPALLQLNVWRELQSQGLKQLPPEADIPVHKVWRDLVDNPDREQAFRALEASVLLGLRRNLRRGSVWVDHTFSFRERDEMLIPPEEWERERERYLKILKLPKTPDKFLDRQLKLLRKGLKRMEAAKRVGKIEVDEQGIIHLPALEAMELDFDPKKVRSLLYEEIGDVQFPDLLLEMDASTNFSEILLGRKAYDDQELLAVYAALIAHGTEIDAKSVAAMIPQLDPAKVTTIMRVLESPGRLQNAIQRVVEFMNGHAITHTWGDGTLASSDMMSLETSRHLWYARIDPRRRTASTGVYSHVLNTYALGYVQQVVLNERQHGPAIEGVVRLNQSNKTALLRLAVDTHGYTNPGMGMAKLLGFDLCVRLRDLKERKLFVPSGVEVPDALASIVCTDISLVSVRKQWDELLRVAASIQSGRISANVAMARLGSAAAGEPLHRASDQLGRLMRSIFLCDYLTLPEFRREMHRVLNRGESVHQLQRAVYYGRVPPSRGRRRDEMAAITASHGLLTNLVLAWNTKRLQETTDLWRKHSRPVEDEWLARIGPAAFAHVNFRGTFRFGLERYRAMLLIDRRTRRAAA